MDPSLLMHMEEKLKLSCLSQCQSGAGPASTLRSISQIRPVDLQQVEDALGTLLFFHSDTQYHPGAASV